MAECMSISQNGGFQVAGRSYHIPEHFPLSLVSSYRTLLRPVPDIPGGTKLTEEQRAVTEAYLHRRAAACVIPGFRMSVSKSLSPTEVETIHRWIASHRPELGGIASRPNGNGEVTMTRPAGRYHRNGSELDVS